MQNILSLFSYQNYSGDNDKQTEIITDGGNFIASREYDRTITARVQSQVYHHHNKDSNNGGGQAVVDTNTIRKTKTILVVDDDQDTTLAVKSSLEIENNRVDNKFFFQIYTYNLPLLALSEFKPNYYDLLLVDVEMPNMNGFELSSKITEIDANPKICFMSAAEVNYEALREIYPTVSVGCFIKKPVSLDHLIRRVRAELE